MMTRKNDWKHSTQEKTVATTRNPLPKDRRFIFTSLGVAIAIAALLSPFASQSPDGLDRVAQDLKFEHKADAAPPAQKLPLFAIFEEYSLRQAPPPLATPLAGLLGTLATFGLAWGIGKIVVRPTQPPAQSKGEPPFK
jgi:cobalt/nickel transport protein